MTEQVETVRTIRQAGDTLGAVIAGVPLAIMGLDRDGCVSLWNPGAERMFGWTAAEVLNRPLPTIPPGREEEFRRNVQAAFAGNTFSGLETRRMRKDGTVIDVAIYTSLVRDHAGRIVSNISVVADISERKRGERDQAFLANASNLLASSLDEGEILGALVRLAVPTLGDWCVVDLLDDAGTLRRVAVACADPANEPLTREFLARYPPDPHAKPGVEPVVRFGQTIHVPDVSDDLLRQTARDPREYEILHALGLHAFLSVPLKVGDRVLGALSVVGSTRHEGYSHARVAVVEDLGRRVALALDHARLFTRIARSERNQRRLAELSRDLAAARLDRSDVLEIVCRAAVAAIGEHASIHLVDSDEQALMLAAIEDTDGDRKKERQRIQGVHPLRVGTGWTGRVVATGEPFFQPVVNLEDLQARTAPEHRACMEGLFAHGIMIVPVRARGRTVGALTVGRGSPGPAYTPEDRTLLQEMADRAAIALENARLYARATRAIKLRDEFLSVAAHELKTPMTGLRGSAQLLLRLLDKNDELDFERLHQRLAVIDQQSAKLGRLVDQLLDVSRLEAGRLTLEHTPTDLVALIRGIAAVAQSRTDQHPIAIDGEATLIASVDALRVEQVITNLVDNAIKYSPDGGPINILVVRAAPNQAEIVVADHGIGIPPEHRAHIFDRFYQAHAGAHYGGMGLGLAISRQIVELHGGRLEVEFPEEGGTRFVVRLPVNRGG